MMWKPSRRRGRLRSLLAGLSLVASGMTPGPALGFDLERYAALLERHSAEVEDLARVRVDYAALSASSEWTALVADLAAQNPAALADREHKLAFWINAYNILAIDLVVRNYPIESLRELGSFFSPVWKRPAGEIGGREYTLDEIEHQILRPIRRTARSRGNRVCIGLVSGPTAAAVSRRDAGRAARSGDPQLAGRSRQGPLNRSRLSARAHLEDLRLV